MTINWADWRSMPDYRQFQNQNKGKSPIAQLARTLDPTTHIPGLKEVANPIHDAATAGIETGNRVLSPVVKAAHGLTDTITPGLKQVRDQVPMLQNVQRFSESNPVDTAAIIVGSIFSGGALGGAAGGAGAGAGTGSLGAAGGSAAGALQGGALSGIGSTTSGLIGSLKGAATAAAPYVKPVMMARDIASNLNNFAGPDVEKLGQRQQQMILAERIRNDQTNPELPNPTFNPQQEKRKRMIDAMMRQPQFFGRNY